MPKDQLERPEDLISAREAGKMAGKKLATIRSWVRKGKITGYRKDPSKKNSTLMISDEELRTYLALNAEPNHPNVKGRPETLSVSLIEKDKRIEELEKLLVLEQARNEALVTNISDLRTFNDRLQTTVDSQSYELKSLRSSFESLLDLQERSQADNKRLMAYIALPWWKRITTSLMLEDKSDNEIKK